MDKVYEAFRKDYMDTETLFNSILDGVIVINTSMETLFWNTAAKKILQQEDVPSGNPEEWAGKFKLYNEKGEFLQMHELPYVKALKGEEFYDYRVVIKTVMYPDGRIISVNGNPIRNGFATVGAINTFRDVTDEVHRISSINTERKLIRNILDLLPRIVTIKDLNGKYLYANKALYELYNTNTILGKSAEEFIKKGDTSFVSENTDIALKSEKPETFRELFTRKDGQKIIIESTRFPFKNDKGNIQGICIIAEDITQHIDSEAESEKDRENITNSSIKSTVGILAKDIVEEIENPLDHLSMSCHRLHKLISEADSESSEILKVLKQAERSILTITETARNLSRMAHSLSKDETETFIFQDIMGDVLKTLSSRIEQMKLNLKTDMPEAAVKMQGNKLQITDVILNLVINALNALENRHDPELEITVTREDHEISIRIVHNGQHMNSEQIERMFAITSTTEIDSFDKIGLGLLTRMIDQQNGDLSYLREETGHGFVLNLPLQ